jgi:hypothetical protein
MKESNEHELKSIVVRNQQLDLRRIAIENEKKELAIQEALKKKRKLEQAAQELVQFQQRIANVFNILL